jgi:hypothetical protein
MDCWEVIVDKWCTEAWKTAHNMAKDRRAQLVGVPHHQGNANIKQYGKKWVCALFSFSCPFIINSFVYDFSCTNSLPFLVGQIP